MMIWKLWRGGVDATQPGAAAALQGLRSQGFTETSGLAGRAEHIKAANTGSCSCQQ